MKLFIIVMALSVIETIITAYLKSPTRLGNAFEKSIAKKLNGKSITGIYGKVLRNVYLPKNEDETSEIDVLFITTIGLFVIECKNYKGWIFGKANSNKWTVTLPSGKNKSRKYHFYNPIKQNNSHIKPLTQFIETQFPDRDIMI